VSRCLVERSPGETRLAWVEKGQLTALDLIRPNAGAQPGAVVLGRLGPALSARQALVRLPGEELALANPPALPEGAPVLVRVTRAARFEPGGAKRAQGVLDPGPERAAPPAIPADAQPCARLPEELGVEELLEAAISGQFALPGGSMSLERTRAGLVIDIDAAGDPLSVSLAAAAEIGRLVKLLQIGGSVLIDFPALGSKAARQAASDRLDAGLPAGWERTAMNGFGLMQLIGPLTRPSLIDILCGPRRNAPSAETYAVRLLRDAMRSVGFGARTITAPPAVAEALRAWPDDLAQAQALLGARLDVVADPSAGPAGFVHVRP
jgi:ribonuclease G